MVAAEALQAGTRVIDLSADFRLADPNTYQQWYGLQHPAPELLDEAVYGLTETFREQLVGARLVANPGNTMTSHGPGSRRVDECLENSALGWP